MAKEKLSTETTRYAATYHGERAEVLVRVDTNGRPLAAVSRSPDGRYKKVHACPGCGEFVCKSAVCMGC